MGYERITQAVDALNGAGLRAQRGYPNGVMPNLTGPVAAVNVGMISAEQTKLLVQVYAAKDGITCEDSAQIASEALADIGALCTVENCRWDSRAGVFFCPVTAIWQEHADCTVMIGSKTLPYATGVTAKKHISRVQVTDPETGNTTEECRNLGWSVTIEEMLPADYMPASDAQSDFTVFIFRPAGTERYEKCQWIQILLENVPGGLRRTRIARTWEARAVLDN